MTSRTVNEIIADNIIHGEIGLSEFQSQEVHDANIVMLEQMEKKGDVYLLSFDKDKQTTKYTGQIVYNFEYDFATNNPEFVREFEQYKASELPAYKFYNLPICRDAEILLWS